MPVSSAVMPSVLDRLLAKAGKTENFVTEAVAAAVELDARPMARLLQLPEGTRFKTPRTQHYLRDPKGLLDLVLATDDDQQEFWFEVKIHSGLSDENQLVKYHQHPERARARAILHTLASERLGDGAAKPLLWQDLRAAIVSPYSPELHWLWNDLRQWLEENGMADHFDDPITRTEANFGAARNLLGKMARVLSKFAKKANEEWKAADWEVREEKIHKAFGDHFVSWGGLGMDSHREFPHVGGGSRASTTRASACGSPAMERNTVLSSARWRQGSTTCALGKRTGAPPRMATSLC